MEGEDRRARTPEPEPLARPSSPWHYQLKRRDANSPARASRALGSSGSGSAATARAANVVHAAARASYEGAMLAAVRRQMESLEEKVEKQLSRQAQDRGREAAVQRLEEKLQATETLQPKVERRLAELSGNFKGLSDEMQAQIRRVDLLDDRRWEWRHQVEEELAKKCQQQEQQVQLLAAGLKTQKGLEDEWKQHQQQLSRLESEVRERATLEQVREGFVNVCGRLEALEAQREEPSRSEVRDVAPSDDFVANSIYEVITKRMEDLERRMEEAFQDNREIHGRMASQEEMMKTLRTLFENREDHLRTLGERVERSDWDLKLEAIRQALQEDHRERTAHAERLELLTKRVEYQEQAIEDVCFVREQVHKEAEPEVSVALLEDQVKALSLELQEMKSENDLGPRVSALLSQLREIAPKVIAHEQSIRQLEERGEEKERKLQELGQLQDQVGRLSASALALKQSASSEEEEKALRKLEELKGDWEKSLQRVQQDVQHRLAGVEEATKSQVELGISRALQAKEPALEAPEEKLQKLRQDMMEELREQRHRMEESQKELSSELHRLLLKSKGEVKAEMTTQLGAVPELLSDAREELRKELAALQDFRRSMETSEAQAALASKEAQSSSLQALEKKLQDLQRSQAEELAKAKDHILAQSSSDEASIERMEATSALTVATRDAVTQLERDLLALKGVPENLQEIQLAMQGFQDRLDASVEAFAADCPHCGDVFAQDSKFCRKCGKPRQRMAEASKEGLQQLQAQVAGLTERLDAFVAAQIQRGTGELPELATLAAALQKDEQEEQAAHTRLLLRIDDLCLNLSKAESGTGWVDKLEALGRQVEEMRTAEKQMEAKLEGFVSTFAK